MSQNNLSSMEYLLSTHNMMIGVKSIKPTPGIDPSIPYTIIDLVRIKKIIAGQASYSSLHDLNCDGVIDSIDLTLMRKLLIGSISIESLPIYQNLNLSSDE